MSKRYVILNNAHLLFSSLSYCSSSLRLLSANSTSSSNATFLSLFDIRNYVTCAVSVLSSFSFKF